MQVRNVTEIELYDALFKANSEFNDNIAFKGIDYDGRTRRGTNKYNVTLTVISSRAPGHRVGFDHARKVKAACWHVHRAFMCALPAQAEVVTTFGTWHPGEPFLDKNVGSEYRPAYASELCDCE